MGEEIRLSRIMRIILVVVLMLSMTIMPSGGCPSDGGECRKCIANRMKTGCPGCGPMMQCMARCLWGGSSRPKCTKKCDCSSDGYPRLSDCKKCFSHCKCSCTLASA